MAMKFVVRRKKPELIVPSKPTPCEIKLLSDIDDQQGLRFHYPMIMFYEDSPNMQGKDPVRVIKEALAKALVYYYPYAGRLIEGPNKKLMVNCTAKGVVFVEASAEVRLEQLRNVMRPPCPCSEELLLDIPGSSGMVGCPLMVIQVTRLQCGGFVLAVRINHVMSDAIGLVQFLKAISQMAQGSSSLSPLPVWRRELLTARNPPCFSFRHNEYEYGLVTKNNGTPMKLVSETLISESFFFGPSEIKAIKEQLPPHFRSSSRFELITAFLWRSRTKALELDEDDEVVSLTCMVTVRGKILPELPNGYYGNAVITPAAVTKAKTLCNNPLGYALELLQKTRAQANEEYVKSAIDFLVLYGKPGFNSNRNWIVSDTSRVGFHEVDFGWGKPIYGGTLDGGSSTYNSIYSNFRNTEGENGVLVPICLHVAAMERFKEEVRKLTQVPMEEFRQPNYIRVPSML